jgi:hypothetical protein
MKKFIILFILLLLGILVKTYAQCPTCPVGSTIITLPSQSTSNLTIPTGTSMCLVGIGTYNGNITLNGGNLYIGTNVIYNPSSQNMNNTNVINNCGTLNKTFNNSNLTINNYNNNTTISYVIDNGVNFNNYGNNVTLNVNNGNPNNPVTITNSINNTLTVNTNISNSNCGSSLGTTTNITNNGRITFPNSVCIKGGLISNNSNMTFSNQLAMDGGTLESKFGSNTSVNILRKNNGNINVYNNSIFNINSIINYDGPSIKMMDIGCSYVTLNTPPSSSFNGNLIDNGINILPNGISYCGGVPRNSASSGNTISSVTNAGGLYRIALTNGNNAPNSGDYVYITGIIGGRINGYWKVIKISNYIYDLVDGPYYPITNLTSNFIYTNNLKFGNGSYLGESGCTNPCLPLPIVFTYIDINQIDNSNQYKISWDFIYDNFKETTIQISYDGKNFTDIFTTYNINDKTYNYFNNNLNNNDILYFRIKSTDMNNIIYYSKISYYNVNNNKISIFPIPTYNGIINLSWIETDDTIKNQTVIELVDLNGIIISTTSISSYKENNIILTDIPKGLYIIKIYNNNVYKTIKIISL